MTRNDADQLAYRMNIACKQGPRFKSIWDQERKGWCVENDSIRGGKYRMDGTGAVWVP